MTTNKSEKKELIEACEVLAELLAKYCHHKNCKYIYKCPAKHPKCKQKLELDTAIAWRLSKKLHSAVLVLTSTDREPKKHEKQQLLELVGGLELAREVLHLHKEQYQELYYLLISGVTSYITETIKLYTL